MIIAISRLVLKSQIPAPARRAEALDQHVERGDSPARMSAGY